jgi:hypothetical protein
VDSFLSELTDSASLAIDSIKDFVALASSLMVLGVKTEGGAGMSSRLGSLLLSLPLPLSSSSGGR